MVLGHIHVSRGYTTHTFRAIRARIRIIGENVLKWVQSEMLRLCIDSYTIPERWELRKTRQRHARRTELSPSTAYRSRARIATIVNSEILYVDLSGRLIREHRENLKPQVQEGSSRSLKV